MDKLNQKRCVPCEGGELPLPKEKIQEYLKKVPEWRLTNSKTLKGKEHPLIYRDFQFTDFVGTMKFVNKVADLAESEGHHPDVYIHQWNKLRLELWTHATGGLHENDFIMAAKIDQIK